MGILGVSVLMMSLIYQFNDQKLLIMSFQLTSGDSALTHLSPYVPSPSLIFSPRMRTGEHGTPIPAYATVNPF